MRLFYVNSIEVMFGRTFLLIVVLSTTSHAGLADDVSCDHRSLVVSVIDASGKPISGLQSSDFQVEFRGKSASILSVARDERPHRIVILIDASGSMRGNSNNDEWALALTLASHVVNAKLPMTSFGLLVFTDRVLEQVDLSQGSMAVRDKIIQIASQPDYVSKKVRGRTALFDAAYAGLRLLDHPTSADELYLISDGVDNSSKTRVEDLERALVTSGVRVYVSLFAAYSPPYPHRYPQGEREGLTRLSDLLKAVGGTVLGPLGNRTPMGYTVYALDQSNRRALDGALLRFYDCMLMSYRVEIELPQPVDKRSTWKLDLAPEARLKFRNAQVSYPYAFAPCEPAAFSK